MPSAQEKAALIKPRRGPTKAEFMDRYARHMSESCVRATQGMNYYFIEDGGEGAYVWDTQGNRVLDFWGVGGVASLGHRNPAVMAEFEAAVKEENFGSQFWYSEAKGKLAEKLSQVTPERIKVSKPCVTGSEAVDESIKFARGATGRYEVLYCTNAYHSHTGFSLTMMTADECRSWAEPLMPGFRQFDYDDAASLAAIISNRTTAVICEVVQTDYSGRASKDANFWQEVRRLCDENGAKLIIDEVVTCMGRLGDAFGCNAYGVDPDMICVGKGFSGGAFPMAAVLWAEDVLDFFGDNPYRSMSTYTWSNGGCRTTKAAIEVNEDNFTALEAFTGMWDRGVNVVTSSQHAPIFKLYPPLILNESHVAEFGDKFEDCVKNAEGGGHQGFL